MDNTIRRVLKEKYPNRQAVLTEIINLEAILHLPKGTEHFVSDLHGEFDAFDHVLRNGSGSVKEKMRECFPDMSKNVVNELAVLIYYPQKKLAYQHETLTTEDIYNWYLEIIPLLLQMTNYCGKKYTRSKVRKALPPRFSYIIEELLTEVDLRNDKKDYFSAIVNKVVKLKQVDELICDISIAIRRLVIDHLHVVGDIYDRGPSPDKIIDRLMELKSVDIQWGNHDIIWMGIAAGSYPAMMNAIRICARYGHLSLLEDGYGINLRPLIEYVQDTIPQNDSFIPILTNEDHNIPEEELILLNKLQHGAAILQFKLESELINRRPEFLLRERDVLRKIDFKNKQLDIKGQRYNLIDFPFELYDVKNPSKLSDDEKRLISHLMSSFQGSSRFMAHMRFLLEYGSMYSIYNENLLYHGCIPLHPNGDFKSLKISDKSYSGRALLDFFEIHVRKSMKSPMVHKDFSTDLLWYLWIGENSSLFGKKAMTTFERYYVQERETHVEVKNAYYSLRDEELICREILKEFGLSGEGRIVNGHTPVQEKNGENPIKANGRLIVIDGGFAKSYQKTTGLAGYTLLHNSYGIQLIAHQPFSSVRDAVIKKQDILSVKRLVEKVSERKKVLDTNIGRQLLKDMQLLEEFYHEYN